MIDKKQNERILENFERIAHAMKILKDTLARNRIGTDTLALLSDEIDVLYKEFEAIKETNGGNEK